MQNSIALFEARRMRRRFVKTLRVRPEATNGEREFCTFRLVFRVGDGGNVAVRETRKCHEGLQVSAAINRDVHTECGGKLVN